MQYDIALKTLLENSKFVFFKEILGVTVTEAEILEELPQETVSVKRTDYPVLVKDSKGKEEIYLVEFQTEWSESKILDMLEYKARYMRKFHKPVHSVYVLLNPNKNSTNEYSDEEVKFNFQLVKIWELEAEKFLDLDESILPLVPLFRNGLNYVKEIERKLYESRNKNHLDMLTIFGLLLGLRDKEQVTEFFRRRKDIMIQSPMYDMILEEGIEKGKLEGKLEGIEKGTLDIARKMIAKGSDIGFVFEITGLTLEDLRREGIVE